MRTLSIKISDLEFSKFGLKKEILSFSDLIELVSREISKKNLNDTVELGGRYKLSDLTMEEISKEVKAVRKNAKSHS
ncbi:MAG: hypothetical protein ABIN89_30330 [Chitinophagaceae bacterium]